MLLHLLPPNNNQPCSLNLILTYSWQTNLILPPLFVQQWEDGTRVHNRYVRYRVLLYPIRSLLIYDFYTNSPWCKWQNSRTTNQIIFSLYNVRDERLAFWYGLQSRVKVEQPKFCKLKVKISWINKYNVRYNLKNCTYVWRFCEESSL